jgi:hypothetical protein
MTQCRKEHDVQSNAPYCFRRRSCTTQGRGKSDVADFDAAKSRNCTQISANSKSGGTNHYEEPSKSKRKGKDRGRAVRRRRHARNCVIRETFPSLCEGQQPSEVLFAAAEWAVG